ncbi:MAG: hypothetical protein K6G18_04970 [Treponema sp.]|nr:hypothetical protein [Treponema sp.]
MKKKRVQLSFKQFVVSVIPYAVIALYVSISFAYLVTSLINKQVNGDMENLAKIVEFEVRQRLEPPAYAANALADSIGNDTGRDYDSIRAIVRGMAGQYPQVASFYFDTAADVASPEGWQLTSDDWQAAPGWSQLDRPWFKGAVAAKGELYASDVYVNARFNKPCISFSRAVYDSKDRSLVGVVGCDIALEQLSDGLAQIDFSVKQVKMDIVDAKGIYLTCDDASYIMNKNYFDVSPIGKKHRVSEYLDGKPKSFIDGSRYYAVRKIGVSPWSVVIEGPTSEFTGTSKFWMLVINIVTIFLILLAIAYTAWYMNRMRGKERELGDKMFTETQNLAVAAKENAATSQDQSAAVKEIVATMEDNNALSENIAVKIKDVSSVAGKTSSDVADGVSHLELNVAQLKEIAEANKNTISGIKNLSEKIDNIWDIVTLINSVADQAKIIAFNAELEASSAGEAGKNFHIVATEIRRLADGIIDGTKEIKEKINEIQQSSDSLILASENGTVKIEEGCDTARSLEERFESIKNASEVTAASAGDITTIIQQQAAASEQILITLKQIAAGVENFTAATESISSASQNLKAIAVELNEQTAQQGVQE